jgi:hypothetical protein
MSVNVTIVQPKPITVGVTTGDGFTLDITRPTYYIHAAAHHSGNNDELNHNLLGGLQGGSGNQYYHLTSGQYSKLNNIVYNTGNQNISGTKNFYIRPTVNGSGVLLDGESLSISAAQGISGTLQGQITTLNNQTGNYALKTETGNFITSSQTGQFYPNSNPSGYLNSSLTSKTIYVDAVGTDSRGVSSKYDLFKPFATIGEAMAASATGDTVRVRAGTYSITSTINLDNEGNLHLEEGVVVNCNVANAPVFTLSVGQSKVISGGGQFNISGTTTKFWQQSGGTTSNQLCSIECYSILTISNSARIFDVSTGVLVVEAGTVYAMTSTIAYCAGTSSNVNYRVPFTYCARMVDMPTNNSSAQFSCVCQTIQCFGTICFRVVGGILGIDYETLVDATNNCTFFSFEYGNSVVTNITTIRGGRAITYSSNPCISFTTTTGTDKLLRLYGDPFFYTGGGTNSITATSARTVLSSSASSNKTFNSNVTIVGNYLVNAGLVY